MSLTLQILVTLLLTAYAHAQNDACFNAMDCTTDDFQNAIYNNDQSTLCRLGPSVTECIERVNSGCDDSGMKAKNKKQSDLLKQSLAKGCGPADVSAPAKACQTAFALCQSDQFEEFLKKKDESSACRVGPGVVACLENAESQCKDDASKSQNRNQVTRFKESLKNCKNTGQTTKISTSVAISKCTSVFSSCVPPEFNDPSNQKNAEKICRLVPGVISCLENALNLCNQEKDQPGVRELQQALNKIRSDLSTSKCDSTTSRINPINEMNTGGACKDGDMSNCNKADFGGMSILYTGFALILAVILQ